MIYLFGDSFVENEPAESLGVEEHERWYQMLSDNLREEHKNYGKCGEGPTASLKKFHKLYEDHKFKANDKFVFVLSSQYRIPWTWLKDESHASQVYEDWQEDKDISERYPDFKSKRDSACKIRWAKCVNATYDSMRDEFDHLNLKNISYLSTISKQNNWQMIVFRVWGMNPNPYSKVYEENLFDFTILNDDLFNFYPIPLYEHSKKEWVDESLEFQGTLNHFTHRNHIILSNIMTNHFKKTNLPTKFHEHFIRGVKNVERRYAEDPNQLVDFIYE